MCGIRETIPLLLASVLSWKINSPDVIDVLQQLFKIISWASDEIENVWSVINLAIFIYNVFI